MKKIPCYLLCIGLITWMSSSLAATASNQTQQSAQRIIALSPHSVEMLFALGAGEQIVATVEYADYPEAANQIPRIGGYAGIQIEKLVELQPDLVVAWQTGNKASDLSKIESLGFKVIYTGATRIEQISDDLLKLGQATGHEPAARELTEKLEQRHLLLKQKYAEAAKIPVFYQMYHDPFRTVGKGSWIESLITDCGGVNIFNQADAHYPVVSLESIVQKNPQVIIIPHGQGSDADKRAIWTSWPVISAVKNQQIYSLNADWLHRFTPRSLDGLEALCQAIDKARYQAIDKAR